MDDSLRPVVSAWISKIQKAWEHKAREFQDDADECAKFYNGPYDWLYSGSGRGNRGFLGSGEDELPAPAFRMTVNKAAELVQLFGPALYHRNPVRKVNPRRFPQLPPETVSLIMQMAQTDPMMMQSLQQMQMQEDSERGMDLARAALLEHYLNYTPEACDLKTESRWAIDEALIKGLGLLWTETYTPPGSNVKLIGSFYDSVDNLLVDPDAETIREAKWIARRCVHPYWEVERDYGLPPDSLKNRATFEGLNQQAVISSAGAAADWKRKQGCTNDLLVYWKIWSKMGLGGRLSGIAPNLRQPLEALGDYSYLVVCEACPFPLNLPEGLGQALLNPDPMMMQQGVDQEVMQRTAWPTPYYADDAWPCTWVYFHSIARKVWPMSHLKPALGELKFLNWAFSFLAGKVRLASRDFIAVMKSASEDLKDKIKHGPDYTIIEVEQLHESIDKVVKFLQHPGFNPEIYTVIQGVSENFERRTGLTELLYGQSARQLRSAQEAQIKDERASIRPDDMASKVEDAMTELARREAFTARWHLTGQDVVPIMGAMGAQWWDMFVTPSDPARIAHGMEYRIEANSARKPNKATEAANMQQAMQQLFSPLMSYAQMTGDVAPLNALSQDWAKSIDLDASKYQFQPPPPPPMPAEASPEAQQGPPV